jgi:hypothetical protein
VRRKGELKENLKGGRERGEVEGRKRNGKKTNIRRMMTVFF